MADASCSAARPTRSSRATAPQVTDEEDIVATKLNSSSEARRHPYVLESADWANTTLLKGDLADEVGSVKAEPGRELQVHGSLDLCQTLVSEGLWTRLRARPLVLGTGKRLFDEIVPTGLELADSKTTSTGVTVQIPATGPPEFGEVPEQ